MWTPEHDLSDFCNSLSVMLHIDKNLSTISMLQLSQIVARVLFSKLILFFKILLCF